MKFSTERQKAPIMSTHCRLKTHKVTHKHTREFTQTCAYTFFPLYCVCVNFSSLLKPEADLLEKLKFLTREIKDELNKIKTVFTLSISDKTRAHKNTNAFMQSHTHTYTHTQVQ